MTLSTHINFVDLPDIEKAIGLTRKWAGIPAGHPWYESSRDYWEEESRVTYKGHIPCGAEAGVYIYICPTGNPIVKQEWLDDDDEEPREHKSSLEGPWYLQIMLDTTYNAIPCCFCTHMNIIRRLYLAFPECRIEWQNEFTGEWFTDPPTQCSQHGFLGVLKPEIERPTMHIGR